MNCLEWIGAITVGVIGLLVLLWLLGLAEFGCGVTVEPRRDVEEG